MSPHPPIMITAAALEAASPQPYCKGQVAAFRATFGEAVTVPRSAGARAALARRLAATWLPCGWYAPRALSTEAMDAYEQAIAPARRAYQEATESSWRAHKESGVTDLGTLVDAEVTIQRAYDEAQAEALLDALVADADAADAADVVTDA